MSYLTDNLLYYIIVISLILFGGTALLIVTGYYHRLLDLLKPDSSKFIQVKVFCEDRQIRDRKLEVGRYVISDHNNRRSFYLVHKLLLSGSNFRNRFLALTERSTRPIDFHNRMTDTEWNSLPSALKVFIDTTADIRSESAKESSGNFAMQSLTIVVLAVAVIVVIMGIILFVQSRGF